jgi:hypothetical protein
MARPPVAAQFTSFSHMPLFGKARFETGRHGVVAQTGNPAKDEYED